MPQHRGWKDPSHHSPPYAEVLMATEPYTESENITMKERTEQQPEGTRTA